MSDDWLLWMEDRWATREEVADFDDFVDEVFDRCFKSGRVGRDLSMMKVMNRRSKWTPTFDAYVMTEFGAPPEEISAAFYYRYPDTDQDWPVKEGLGDLLLAVHAESPVSLNTTVSAIDWSSRPLRVTTSRGTVTAAAVIVTVFHRRAGGRADPVHSHPARLEAGCPCQCTDGPLQQGGASHSIRMYSAFSPSPICCITAKAPMPSASKCCLSPSRW